MAPKHEIPSSNNASWLSQCLTSHSWPTASLFQTFVFNGQFRTDNGDAPSRLLYLRDDFVDAGSVEVAQNEFGPARFTMTSYARLINVWRAHLKWANINAVSFPIPDAAPDR